MSKRIIFLLECSSVVLVGLGCEVVYTKSQNTGTGHQPWPAPKTAAMKSGPPTELSAFVRYQPGIVP